MFRSIRKGFTLIEVIIAIAMLAVMILLVIPRVKNAVEVSNIKKDISVAINISNKAIMLKKEGAEISSDSWKKARS